MEATALIRRAEAQGDFATILKRGDPDRGSLLLMVGRRGRHVLSLERMLTLDGDYAWQQVGPGDSSDSEEIRDFIQKRTRFDADLWVIELDIADPERFIAETIPKG